MVKTFDEIIGGIKNSIRNHDIRAFLAEHEVTHLRKQNDKPPYPCLPVNSWLHYHSGPDRCYQFNNGTRVLSVHNGYGHLGDWRCLSYS